MVSSSHRNPSHEAALPTLADVAKRAKVSTATVSRCLNAPDRVVGDTRKRVLAAVRELGYAPNFGAQALAARQTHTVGAVIPTMENAMFAQGLQAFQEELGRHGKTLIVASSSYDATLEDEQVRALVARGADGLLLIGYDHDPELYEFLKKRRVPTVVAWSFSREQDWPAIGFDNRSAMAALARQVIGQGHRKIACISPRRVGNDRARLRVEGIKDAMEQAGLPAQTLILDEVPYGIEAGKVAFRTLRLRHPDVTAVICINDVLAMGALYAARAAGVSVPGEMSITGFGDIELARLADPGLTTVHVPHREMGKQAAGLILDMLKTGAQPDSIELPAEIQLRGSLGKAPDAG